MIDAEGDKLLGQLPEVVKSIKAKVAFYSKKINDPV